MYRPQNALAAQFATFAHQVALFEVYRKRMGQPGGVIGISRGTAAAYYVSGVLTLEQAAELILLDSHYYRAASNSSTTKRRLALVQFRHPTEMSKWFADFRVRFQSPWSESLIPTLIITPLKLLVAVQADAVELLAALLNESNDEVEKIRQSILPATAHDKFHDHDVPEAAIFNAFLTRIRKLGRNPKIPVWSSLQPGKQLKTLEEIIEEERLLGHTTVRWDEDTRMLGLTFPHLVEMGGSGTLEEQKMHGLLPSTALVSTFAKMEDLSRIQENLRILRSRPRNHNSDKNDRPGSGRAGWLPFRRNKQSPSVERTAVLRAA